jgi:hypothetical protein
MKIQERCAALLVLFCLACESMPQAEIKAGTEVPLILLTELSSGGSEQGKEVAFMVTKDVMSEDNRVLIPRGAIAYGRVAWSRSAGAVSKFLNEPARLAVSIDRTVASDGKTVYLQATKSPDHDPLHFTGENTGVERASDELEKILADEASKKALAAMLEGLSGKDMGSSDIIAALASKLNLSAMKQLADANSLNDLAYVLKGIAQGQVTRVATGHALLVIDAISELAGIRKSVGDRISGLFKGRNIKAFPGTPVTAYVAEKLLVDAPSPK